MDHPLEGKHCNEQIIIDSTMIVSISIHYSGDKEEQKSDENGRTMYVAVSRHKEGITLFLLVVRIIIKIRKSLVFVMVYFILL